MATQSARLDRLIQRAATLQERCVAPNPRPGHERGDPAPTGTVEIDDLLHRWSDVVSPGDGPAFDRRLACFEADRETLRARFSVARPVSEAPSLETLQQVIARTAAWWRKADVAPPSPDLPFSDLLEPAIEVAREKLAAVPSALVASSALDDLVGALRIQLTGLAAPSLHNEFERGRPAGINLLVKLGPARMAAGRDAYLAFVRRHGRDGLLTVLERYPVLARRLGSTIDRWVATSRELLSRLAADRDLLREHFQTGSRLVDVVTSLSDPHDGGRSVAILTFEDSSRVVYKPRDLRVHAAFNQFLEWTTSISDIELATLRVLPRHGYGWVEFVAPRGCRDRDEARTFYHRAGALLCALQVLGGNDCHYENLIARGGDPILVDVETLLHADLADAPQDPDDPIADSVLRVGMLPTWELSPDRRLAYDLSGLGSDEVPEALRRRWTWASCQTDLMHPMLVADDDARRENIPSLKGERLRVTDFVDELTTGFEATYRAMVTARNELTSARGPLAAFMECTTRFVFRPTRIYAAILEQCASAEACASGDVWGLALEQLARAFSDSQHLPLQILEAEIQAMTAGDVPLFTTEAGSRDLAASDGTRLLNVIERSGLDATRSRVARMSEPDLAFQVEAVRGACAARAFSPGQTAAYAEADNRIEPLELVPQICVEEARAIANSLVDRALRNDEGRVEWLGFGYSPETERLILCPTPQGLYDGRCGIALFLSALDFVTGESAYRDLRRTTVRPFWALLDPGSPARRSFAESTLGLATGTSGVMWTLMRLSQMCGEDERSELEKLALAASEFIDRDAIARDDDLDLLDGSAGAVIALLQAARVTGRDSLLERARWCGDHLVERLRAPSAANPMLTGLSHGASGIAWALEELADTTGDERYAAAAIEVLEYERTHFDSARRNWADLRWAGGPHFQSSWCHGAPGIALARLAMRKSPERVAELEVALDTTARTGLQAVDNLCCGNLGLTDVLLCGAELTGRRDLLIEARARAGRVVARARRDGFYRVIGAVQRPLFAPGLFQGTPGIGYQLLRLAFPDRLPSVLGLRGHDQMSEVTTRSTVDRARPSQPEGERRWTIDT
jgi:type 2 lantibiotic biosynthesis protein LanM